MLSELLQGIESGGFLIIRDSCSYSGRDLLKSFITAASNRVYPRKPPAVIGHNDSWREEVTHVLCFDVSEEELKDGLKPSDIQRLHIHNAYSDPLGWTGHPNFTAQQFSLEDLTNLVKQTSPPKPAVLVIDSLSWILRHKTPPAVCQTLQQLRKGGAVRAVIGLLHTDMHQRGTVGSVCHLATSLISVAPGVKGKEAVARVTKRSKSGKVMQDEEIFCIAEDFTVTILSKPNHSERKTNSTEEEQADPTANLTFNLRLSDSELEAKQKLTLPFVFSKEKKTALLHPGPGSGRILYEPDANDDYDQEDPDDDLDV